MWTKIKDLFSYGERIKKQDRDNRERVISKSIVDTRKTRNTNKNIYNVKGNPEKERNIIRTAVQIKDMAIKHNYKGPLCQYCGSQSEIKTAREHRGKDKEYCYWVCPTCPNTSVTTIKNSYKPAGDLADAETRLFRMEVQKLIHTKRKSVTRTELQNWIHDTTLVPLERAYIGRLSKDDLARVAVRSQKEEFEKRYSYIFNKV